MRPVPQLIAMLKADAQIAAAVGERVYADNPPQDDEIPYIVLTVNSTQAWGTINNHQVKAYVGRITAHVISPLRSTSEDLQERLEDLLLNFQSTDSTHPVQGVTPDSGVDWALLVPQDGSDERGYWCSQEFLVSYRRV